MDGETLSFERREPNSTEVLLSVRSYKTTEKRMQSYVLNLDVQANAWRKEPLFYEGAKAVDEGIVCDIMRLYPKHKSEWVKII